MSSGGRRFNVDGFLVLGVVHWFEQGDVECRRNAIGRQKLELVCDKVDLLDNSEGTYVMRT